MPPSLIYLPLVGSQFPCQRNGDLRNYKKHVIHQIHDDFGEEADGFFFADAFTT